MSLIFLWTAAAEIDGANPQIVWPEALLPGDACYVFGGFTKNSVAPGVSTGGYTTLVDQIRGAYRGGLWRKVQGVTPDTVADCLGSGDALDGAAYFGLVCRGQNALTPEDVAVTVSTTTTPAPITTATVGDLIFICSMGTTIDVAGLDLAGFNFVDGAFADDTRDAGVNFFYQEGFTVETVTPPAITGYTITDPIHITVAVRPAGTTCDTDLCSIDLDSRHYVLNNWWNDGGADISVMAQSISTGAAVDAWATTWNIDRTDEWTVTTYSAAILGWHWGWHIPAAQTGLPVQLDDHVPIDVDVDFTLTPDAACGVSRTCRFDVAFDLWLHTQALPTAGDTPVHEIMIWLAWSRDLWSGATIVATPTIAGIGWDVLEIANPVPVTVFLRHDGDLNTFTGDLTDFTDWLVTNRAMPDTWYLTSVQFGPEIFKGLGTLAVTRYAVDVGAPGIVVSNGTVVPSPALASEAIDISADITVDVDAPNLNVTLSVYTEADAYVTQHDFTAEDFVEGVTRTFTWNWAGTATVGNYVVKCGVFSTDWVITYKWTPDVAAFHVGAPPSAPLSVVGTFANSAINGGNVTLTPPVMLPGDLVLIGGGFTNVGVQPGVSTAGFTELRDDTSGAYRGRLMSKVMGATPDTSFTGIGSGNIADGASYIGIVFRSADAGTPMDAAVVLATAAASNPNPAPITTVTDTACVVVITTGTGVDVAGVAIAGYVASTGAAANDTRDSASNLARKENKSPAGVEDPPAWTGLTIGASVTWTIAVRPATGSSVLVPWLDTAALTLNQPQHSHYRQPWKGWIEPRQATVLKYGLGINVNVATLGDPATLCATLLAAGIRNLRFKVAWSTLATTNTLTGAARTWVQSLLTQAHALGIRPTITVHAPHSAPNPAINVTRTLSSAAALGAATVTLNSVTGLVAHYSGLNDLTQSKYCEVLFSNINTSTRVCTLAKPLPVALSGGASVTVGTLLFRPFTEPGRTEYNTTCTGWLDYVREVCAAAAEVGVTDFDLELWDDLDAGSDYLFHEAYYDPPLFTPSPDDPRAPNERVYEIGRQTIAMLTAEYPTVRPIWGFSNSAPPNTTVATMKAMLVSGIDHTTPLADIQAELDMAQGLGSQWVRTDFFWYSVELAEGVWTWDHFDRLVTETTARRMRIVPILWCPPAWAATTPFSPPNRTKWIEFVTLTATRYKNTVRVWEIWNEPDTTWYWTGTPTEYANILSDAYTAIKAIDPGLEVWLGGLAQGGDFMVPNFMEDIVALGAAAHVDATNVHTNFRTMAQITTQVNNAKAAFPGKQVVTTENSYTSDINWQGLPGYLSGQASMADYLTDAYLLLQSLGVTCAVWAGIKDYDIDTSLGPYHGSGLYTYGDAIKPAGTAFAALFHPVIGDLPANTAGQSYHPYEQRHYDGVEDEQYGIANNAEGYAPTAPPYVFLCPEGALTWITYESLIHQLAQPTRDTTFPPTETSFRHYQTEQGFRPADFGVVTEAEGNRTKALYVVRAAIAWLHRGLDVLHLYTDIATLGLSATDRACSYALLTDAYAATPSVEALARLMALVAPAQDVVSPATLTIDVNLSPNDVAVAGNGGTVAALMNRDILAVFPFQVSQTDWMIPAYIMTRDITAAAMTPVTATIRFTGLDGTGITSTAQNLLTGAAVAVSVVEAQATSLTVSFLVSETPAALVLTGPVVAGGGQPVRTHYYMAHRRAG